jgi:hypothetical protein
LIKFDILQVFVHYTGNLFQKFKSGWQGIPGAKKLAFMGKSLTHAGILRSQANRLIHDSAPVSNGNGTSTHFLGSITLRDDKIDWAENLQTSN